MREKHTGHAGEGNDSLLVKRLKSGDIEALRELVSTYRTRIYQTAYQMTGNRADADDLSQEAFIRAYYSIKGFDERSAFHTWLYRIVVNLTINHLKAKRRRRHFSLDEETMIEKGEPELAAVTKDTPRKALEAKELHENIARAIDSLPLAEKTVLILVILQGLSHRQAGEVEGCPEKTISSRLFRARGRLRKKLQLYLETKGGI